MDNMLQYIINLLIFVPLILILIVVSLRLSKASMSTIAGKKYTKVLEVTNLKKDIDLFVLKIGDEGCVLVSSPSKVDKIKDLTKEEINSIEKIKDDSEINLGQFTPRYKKFNFFGNKSKYKSLKVNKSDYNNLNLSKYKIDKLNLKRNKYGRFR
ncbi:MULTISPECIES: FliO/MopB family protein [unclassified Romboutsia]|nr:MULTISPECIES: FliO/MopB family protein [unclassified Romboutsia]MDB8806754.1 flagellar biosynthesis protein FliZ [Romboutsia sp. 1001216sp1]MDB8815292.1 flagellar biosynthesis protein FliZ [Romboutsia sp. 1001216sp1]